VYADSGDAYPVTAYKEAIMSVKTQQDLEPWIREMEDPYGSEQQMRGVIEMLQAESMHVTESDVVPSLAVPELLESFGKTHS
jgi:hypothetical protein